MFMLSLMSADSLIERTALLLLWSTFCVVHLRFVLLGSDAGAWEHPIVFVILDEIETNSQTQCRNQDTQTAAVRRGTVTECTTRTCRTRASLNVRPWHVESKYT